MCAVFREAVQHSRTRLCHTFFLGESGPRLPIHPELLAHPQPLRNLLFLRQTVACVGVDNARNAALLAIEILALADEGLMEKLGEYRRERASRN